MQGQSNGTSSSGDLSDSDLSTRIEGRIGRITLNRPKALNALTHSMVLRMEAALLDWRDNKDIALVLIDAVGDKAFCAGGDVNALYQSGKAGDVESGRLFWRDEYRLNAMIKHYPKPYIAFMDRIVMGGGVGISAHGSHRIVTDLSSIAMPECLIGLIPDVGATHLLSQCPGFVGEYLALSGERIGGSDAVFAGLADYYVPAHQLATLKKALIETGDVRSIGDFQQSSEDSSLAEIQHEIDSVFGQESLASVLEQLEGHNASWTQKALKKIAISSPLSLQVAFQLIRKARMEPGIEAALQREFRFVSRAVKHSDFLEGVRAAIIDKDRQPTWQHSSLADVTSDEIEQFNVSAPGGDVVLIHDQA
ncbi:MAG: enoyl-CoA hydratase/isomerase family protein [Granulosicoccus sp.]